MCLTSKHTPHYHQQHLLLCYHKSAEGVLWVEVGAEMTPQVTPMEPSPPSLHSYGANKGNDSGECSPGCAQKHELEKAVASMSGQSLNLSSSSSVIRLMQSKCICLSEVFDVS